MPSKTAATPAPKAARLAPRVLVLVEDLRRHQEMVLKLLKPIAAHYSLEVVVLENYDDVTKWLEKNGVKRVAMVISDGNLGFGPTGMDVLRTFVNQKFAGPFTLFSSDPLMVDDAHRHNWAALHKGDGVEALAFWADAELAKSETPA